MSVKPRVVEHCLGFCRGVGIQECGNRGVAFAIERWEEINEQGEHATSQEEFYIEIVYLREYALKTIHHAREIERDEAAGNAKEYIRWHA